MNWQRKPESGGTLTHSPSPTCCVHESRSAAPSFRTILGKGWVGGACLSALVSFSSPPPSLCLMTVGGIQGEQHSLQVIAVALDTERGGKWGAYLDPLASSAATGLPAFPSLVIRGGDSVSNIDGFKEEDEGIPPTCVQHHNHYFMANGGRDEPTTSLLFTYFSFSFSTWFHHCLTLKYCSRNTHFPAFSPLAIGKWQYHHGAECWGGEVCPSYLPLSIQGWDKWS